MGVHAVNPSAPEFHNQPFTATFLYGYYNKQQTFIEPMAAGIPQVEAVILRPGDAARLLHHAGRLSFGL